MIADSTNLVPDDQLQTAGDLARRGRVVADPDRRRSGQRAARSARSASIGAGASGIAIADRQAGASRSATATSSPVSFRSRERRQPYRCLRAAPVPRPPRARRSSTQHLDRGVTSHQRPARCSRAGASITVRHRRRRGALALGGRPRHHHLDLCPLLRRRRSGGRARPSRSPTARSPPRRRTSPTSARWWRRSAPARSPRALNFADGVVVTGAIGAQRRSPTSAAANRDLAADADARGHLVRRLQPTPSASPTAPTVLRHGRGAARAHLALEHQLRQLQGAGAASPTGCCAAHRGRSSASRATSSTTTPAAAPTPTSSRSRACDPNSSGSFENLTLDSDGDSHTIDVPWTSTTRIATAGSDRPSTFKSVSR